MPIKWMRVGERMKKLISIICALCLLSGYPTECVPKVIEIFADPEYSVQEKEIAISVVTEQLEGLYECLVNGENPYAKHHICNQYYGGDKWKDLYIG